MSFLRSHWIMLAAAAGLGVAYLLYRSRSGGSTSAIPASVSPQSLAPDGSGSQSGGGDLSASGSPFLPAYNSSPYETSTPVASIASQTGEPAPVMPLASTPAGASFITSVGSQFSSPHSQPTVAGSAPAYPSGGPVLGLGAPTPNFGSVIGAPSQVHSPGVQL